MINAGGVCLTNNINTVQYKVTKRLCVVTLSQISRQIYCLMQAVSQSFVAENTREGLNFGVNFICKQVKHIH